MKKPVLSIDEPEPKKILRADRPPTEGFATVVDGLFKAEFDTLDAAEAAGRKLKSAGKPDFHTSHQIPARVIEVNSARAATLTFAVCEPYAGEG